MKPTVVQLTCVYPPYGGGIGRVAYDYAAWLRTNYQVTVFTPRYKKNQTFVNLPAVTIKAPPPLLSVGKAAIMPTWFNWLKNFEIVHLHYPWFGLQEILPWLPKTSKLVISYHMKPTASGFKGWLFKQDSRLWEKKLLTRADALICSTKDYLTEVVNPPSVTTAKWHILPFAPAEQFKPKEPNINLRNSLGIHQAEAVILFVGTLDKAHYFKGLPILLKAAQQLNRAFKILIVGGGRQDFFKKMVKELSLEDRVIFTGFVSDKQLPDYYNLAEIVVFPSLNQSESFGLVALQALACAKPVVASKLPGVQSLVQTGVNGLLVPAKQPNSLAFALDSLLAAPKLAKEYGLNGLKLVEKNYSASQISLKLNELYQSLL
ncbi:glycosyltransferase family 4 protein [Patescibacteria group bacterium]|nr:glycosyltransferase family 4 protein [Patescibacteria group bacterium]